MGLNLDLTKMLGLSKTVQCPRCKNTIASGFHDYDVESGNPNPSPGEWKLMVFCQICEHEWVEHVTVKGSEE